MPDNHYVYSARNTKEGLALLNKTRGDRGWDSFVNKVVAEHYGLDPTSINPPQSKFLTEREEKRKAREAEKAMKAAEKKAKEKPQKPAKKTVKGAKDDDEK